MIGTLFSGINVTGLAIVFALTFLASLGVPGGLVWITSLGALANTWVDLIPIIIAASLGAILGDMTAYELAKRFSLRLHGRLVKFPAFRNNEMRARELLSGSMFTIVFFSRWALTGICAVVSYISGFERLDRKKFIIAVITGEFLYGAVYPLIGFLFKETWSDLTNVVGDILMLAGIALIITFIVIVRRTAGKRIAKRSVRKTRREVAWDGGA